MGINSVNIGMGASSYGAYNQKLTSETRQELEQLGIPFDKNITEAEGKQLLMRYTEAKANKTSTDNQSNSKSNSEKSDLFKRAEALASQLGIQIDEKLTLEQILAIIEDAISNRVQANKNNPEMLMQLKSLGQKLANLQAEVSGSSGFDNTNQALMESLEMLSEYNKSFLNQ